jgi:hypothetical protein
MKKTFTKLFSTGLLMGLTFIGFAVNAQSTSLAKTDSATVAPKTNSTGTVISPAKDPVFNPATAPAATTATTTAKAADPVDTAWHPQRRVWGYSFGDYYYDAHSPSLTSTQGKENSFYQVPTYRNAFVFRRIYLGYDYEISKKFKAEMLLASEPTANTNPVSSTVGVQNSDNLADGKMSFYIKNINVRMRDLFPGTDFVIGELSTPSFALNEPGTNAPTSLSETTWSYRSVERTITDFHKNNSFDVGAALQGTFDPKTKNFGYVLMMGDNTQSSLLSAANANTGFYKIFYGDLWAKLFNQHLYIDLYADYARTAPATYLIGGQDHQMTKLFVSYVSKPITIGVEAYTQELKNGVEITTSSTTKTPSNADVKAISLWIRGPIVPQLNFFARFDDYDPDTNYNGMFAYAANTNYSSYDPTTKEKFVTAGLDWNPTKNVHFEPNLWLVQYVDQENTTLTGYVPNNHTLIYRLTFFFTFGK